MLSVTSGQQRWRFDTSAKVLIQLLLFVLYAGTCTATNGKKISGIKGEAENQIFISFV